MLEWDQQQCLHQVICACQGSVVFCAAGACVTAAGAGAVPAGGAAGLRGMRRGRDATHRRLDGTAGAFVAVSLALFACFACGLACEGELRGCVACGGGGAPPTGCWMGLQVRFFPLFTSFGLLTFGASRCL
jgi:hypothetical protein